MEDYRRIDLDERTKGEMMDIVFSTMLAHIKEKNEQMFTSEILSQYQTKIDHIMESLFPVSGFHESGLSVSSKGDKVDKAMEMLRGPKPKN